MGAAPPKPARRVLRGRVEDEDAQRRSCRQQLGDGVQVVAAGAYMHRRREVEPPATTWRKCSPSIVLPCPGRACGAQRPRRLRADLLVLPAASARAPGAMCALRVPRPTPRGAPPDTPLRSGRFAAQAHRTSALFPKSLPFAN